MELGRFSQITLIYWYICWSSHNYRRYWCRVALVSTGSPTKNLWDMTSKFYLVNYEKCCHTRKIPLCTLLYLTEYTYFMNNGSTEYFTNTEVWLNGEQIYICGVVPHQNCHHCLAICLSSSYVFLKCQVVFLKKMLSYIRVPFWLCVWFINILCHNNWLLLRFSDAGNNPANHFVNESRETCNYEQKPWISRKGKIKHSNIWCVFGDSKSYLSGLPRLRINVWAYFGRFILALFTSAERSPRIMF